jgi:pimeloyl-ACP methyl ester carboxylesterase
MYRHVLDGLSDSYRVIAVDAVAHGKTVEPAGGPFQSLTQHAELNEKLIAALKLEKPVIIGCSMGGNMVLEMAARKPDAYRAVCLLRAPITRQRSASSFLICCS